MTSASVPGTELSAAVTRLDQDIAEAERRLAELRAMRESIKPFIAKYLQVTEADSTADGPALVRSTSLTDEVLSVFATHPGDVLDVDDVFAYVQNNGVEASRDAVRNAINYTVRLGKVLRDHQRRGRYILKGPSTSVLAGVEVSEEPDHLAPQS